MTIVFVGSTYLLSVFKRQPPRLGALFHLDCLLLHLLLHVPINRILLAQHALRWCAVADFPLCLVEAHYMLRLEPLQKLAASTLAWPAKTFNLSALKRVCFQFTR
jgi:hypothetical protein